MVSLLESVINNGTGAGVRTRGFYLPAAGKTGTSHDGWFAGFTSNLLAVAWVGYDDDRDLNLTGAQSALPLWTEFMKRTTGLSIYKTPQPFNQPDGIETAAIDNLTNLVALADPGSTHTEVFIAGHGEQY
jgi:penicillin-binding protein 1B